MKPNERDSDTKTETVIHGRKEVRGVARCDTPPGLSSWTTPIGEDRNLHFAL